MHARSVGARLSRVWNSIVVGPCRKAVNRWNHFNPAQQLLVGFMSYVVFGVACLSLPTAQLHSVALVDNLFNVTSAISTTGLTTVSVSDTYSWFGQFVLVCLFQLGGIGYMTLSSFILISRGRKLSDARRGVLSTEFALPNGFDISHFIRDVVLFTGAIETIGTCVLYREFAAAGLPRPLWSAVFHCVSAFATAGFSLYNDGLEGFRGNGLVCLTIGILAYLGAIGFIVIQDAWKAVRSRGYDLTFTTKVILGITALVFVVGTPLLYVFDPYLQKLPALDRGYAAAFQVMTASSTAGFNTVPISAMSAASLALITVVMIVGASPSGTGGGIKTTTLSSLLAVLFSMLRRRQSVVFWGHEIPPLRVLTATASATLYLFCLSIGVYLLCLVQKQDFLAVVFEAASALGTVGLSLGITSQLTFAGKLIITGLMFVGRLGPLTLGLALLRERPSAGVVPIVDLAV